MRKFCHSPFLHSIKSLRLTRASAFSSSSDSPRQNPTVSNVLARINSVDRIWPSLNQVSRFLSREDIVSVLQSQARLGNNPIICFRFFIWSAWKARLRSGLSRKIIVDMLVSSCESNSFDLYWSVLDELSSKKIPIPADAFAVLMLGYWRLGKAEKAVATYSKMKNYECEPNLAVYNVLLDVLVKKGVILLAMAIYNKLMKSNLMMGCDTYNTLLDGLCKSGMTKTTLKLFDEMTVRGISPNRITYTVIVSGLCKEKRTDEAYKLFEVMKNNGCRPDAATYHALLSGLCKCGKIDEALMRFESIVNEGDVIGIEGYSCLVDGLIRAKRISEAQELVRKAFEVGIVPDVVLYTIMLRGLCEAGKLKEATAMLQTMIEVGVVPDTQCYNVLIKGFCDMGLLDEARSLKLEISRHDQFPTTYTYTILICALCRNGVVGEAQQIFNDLERVGCSPSIVTFNVLINGLCKAGELEEANLMRYKMEIGKNPSLFLRLSQGSDRVPDNTSLQQMVENLVDSGDVLKAYKLLTQLADHSGVLPDIITYNTLINGFCKAGEVDGALKLFNELQIRGLVPDSVTYSTLINGLQFVGKEEHAFKMFEKMDENGCAPNQSVYKTLMTWCCRRSKLSVAFSIWLRYLRSLAVKEEALQLSEEYFKKGDMVKAVKSLLELCVELPDFDSSPCNIWLIGLCQGNRTEEALKIFSLLEEFNVDVYAPGCVNLINALCAVGNLNKAVDVFLYTMKKRYLLKPGVCNSLLRHLLNSKDKAPIAHELVDRMQSVGYSVNSHIYPVTRSLLREPLSVQNREKAVG
ncbi:pentatricopeptide repeat-containing protein At1g79540 [Andrographis paniculata]|uniref:pentatricopeptide repeat-containing protein At1g79540 n=1 Tax=Andrographis paniculata TaxID=175694 RepID=UPI0021E6E06F|nr:pentatricopeptide repeat-containing protein At1g79540 [Andrographis paniculata]XP_051116809.1 pentatricopeptide repeat-containing protein At1g79540 [Andrographis paniculata]XP_051116810.1 pentatricopeptide repeat-containing protein At1g79540 [Andrographis paniculata]XP_051116811.1 pentatricopeptide repeat-containing protein At1g79540 [Andrographis paniculata]XP_051116812.1 pentatricopeptide repeat-containing protein At1g79540 [Andrographis paniculata]XP_051116813.1 pentatricopeptide repeat-